MVEEELGALVGEAAEEFVGVVVAGAGHADEEGEGVGVVEGLELFEVGHGGGAVAIVIGVEGAQDG